MMMVLYHAREPHIQDNSNSIVLITESSGSVSERFRSPPSSSFMSFTSISSDAITSAKQRIRDVDSDDSAATSSSTSVPSTRSYSPLTTIPPNDDSSHRPLDESTDTIYGSNLQRVSEEIDPPKSDGFIHNPRSIQDHDAAAKDEAIRSTSIHKEEFITKDSLSEEEELILVDKGQEENRIATSLPLGTSISLPDTKTIPMLVQDATSTATTAITTITKKVTRRQVHFQDIEIRRYPMILGDNPSCRIGPPVSLGWEFESLPTMTVDDYEVYRTTHPRKSHLHLMILNYYQRTGIMERSGVDPKDVQTVERQVAKIQRQRQHTAWMAPLFRVEDIARSAGRKLQRAMHRRQQHHRDDYHQHQHHHGHGLVDEEDGNHDRFHPHQ